MTTRTNLLLPSYVLSAVHAFAQVIVAFYNLLRFLSPIHLATELDDVHKCYYQCQCNGIEQTIYVMSSVMIVYFTIDLVLMYKTSSLSLSFVLHHFTFAFAAILQLAFNRSCFPYLWLSFGELSTLFLNARWYLKYHKNDVNTTKFIIVETLFAVTFFITRIVIYGLGLLHFFHYDKNIFNTTELWQITPFLFVGGYLLNAFWLAKIVGMMTKDMKHTSLYSTLSGVNIVVVMMVLWLALYRGSSTNTTAATTATPATTATLASTLVDVWERHTACEFDPNFKSVECTMATMTANPIVLHVPTMIGGNGTEEVEMFYKRNFIFANPEMKIELVSRTIGVSSIVDEMVLEFEHYAVVDWLAPSVKPTFKTIRFPLIAVVAFEGELIKSEHIYWDQAGVLLQMGVVKKSFRFVGDLTGAEQARLVPTNALLKRAGRAKSEESEENEESEESKESKENAGQEVGKSEL